MTATRTFYHGTSSVHLPAIQREGLCAQRTDFGRWSAVFVTNSQEATQQYAQLAVQLRGGSPLVFQIELPFAYQPNGSPAPPFTIDDWHTDSGMPGEAWEYDAPIAFTDLHALH